MPNTLSTQQHIMLDNLPEPILETIYKYKHNIEYVNTLSYIKMFRTEYEVAKLIDPVYGDRHPQIIANIPIKTVDAINKKTYCY